MWEEGHQGVRRPPGVFLLAQINTCMEIVFIRCDLCSTKTEESSTLDAAINEAFKQGWLQVNINMSKIRWVCKDCTKKKINELA